MQAPIMGALHFSSAEVQRKAALVTLGGLGHLHKSQGVASKASKHFNVNPRSANLRLMAKVGSLFCTLDLAR